MKESIVRKIKKGTAASLAIAMILNATGVPVLAGSPGMQPGGGISSTVSSPSNATPSDATPPNWAPSDTPVFNKECRILSVDIPAGTKDWMLVDVGTKQDMLKLPTELMVVCEDKGTTVAGVMNNITWSSKGAYHPDQEGAYQFVPQIPSFGKLEAGVTLPEITVYVGKNLITQFLPFDKTKAFHVVNLGIVKADLNLPKTLQAVWTDGKIASMEAKSVDVTWESQTVFDGNTQSMYVFEAKLPKGYVTASGVNPPNIVVQVGKLVDAAASRSYTFNMKFDIAAKSYTWLKPIKVDVTVNNSVDPSLLPKGEVSLQFRKATSSNASYTLETKTVALDGKGKATIPLSQGDLLTFEPGLSYDARIHYVPLGAGDQYSNTETVAITQAELIHENLKATGTFESKVRDLRLEGSVSVKGSNPKYILTGNWSWIEDSTLDNIPECGSSNPQYAVRFVLNTPAYKPYFTNYNMINDGYETSVKPVVEPLKLYMKTATIQPKEYNGKKDDGTIDQITFTKTEHGTNEFTPADLNMGKGLTEGTDYTVSVTYGTENAQVTTTATIKFTMKSPNYTVNNTTRELQNVTISKSSVPPKVDSVLQTYSLYDGEDPKTVSIKLDTLYTLTKPDSVPNGTIERLICKSAVYSGANECLDNFVLDRDNRILTFTTKRANVGAKTTLDIVFETGNFQDIPVQLVLEVFDQLQVTPKPPKSDVSVTGKINYLETLASASNAKKLKLTGTFVDGTNTSVTVKGDLVWDDPTQSFDKNDNGVESTVAVWRFEPIDKKYATATGKVDIKSLLVKLPASSSPLYDSFLVSTEQASYTYGIRLGDIRLTHPQTAFEAPDTVPGVGINKPVVVFDSGNPNYETAKKTIEVTITKANLDIRNVTPPTASGVYLTPVSKLKLNGGVVRLDNGTILTNGKWAWSKNQDQTTLPVVNGTQSFTVDFIPSSVDAKNYNGISVEVIPTMEALRLSSITSVTLQKKTYDGSSSGTIDTIKCKSSNGPSSVTLSPGDYISQVRYENHNAGKRPATVKINPANDNFVFSEMQKSIAGQTIEPADYTPIIRPNEITMQVTMPVKGSGKFTFDLNQFRPIPAAGQETGDLSFKINAVSTNIGKYTASNSGILTATTKTWPGSAVRDDKITVTVSSENYRDSIATLHVKATNKSVPKLGNGETVTYSSKIGINQPVSGLQLNQSVLFVNEKYETVPGTLQWQEPNQTYPKPGTYSAIWQFIPTDSNTYAVITGVVDISVEDNSSPVIVEGGSGGGSYPIGAVVNISATVPDDKFFDHWTAIGVDLEDASKASTSFIMPAHPVTVTASLRNRTSYTVTVENGNGSGTFLEGSSIQIQAPDVSGQTFVKWSSEDGVTFAEETSASTSFILPSKHVTVTATYAVSGGGSGGDGSGSGGGGSSGGGSGSGGGGSGSGGGGSSGGGSSGGGSGSGGGGSSGGGGGGGGGSSSGGGGSSSANSPKASFYPPVAGHWRNDQFGWWFRKPDGTYAANEFIYVQGSPQNYWYFFDANGYMQTGWLIRGFYTYYLEQNAQNGLGRMVTGWNKIDGKYYYFDNTPGATDGAMLRNTKTPDGLYVGLDGAWIQ